MKTDIKPSNRISNMFWIASAFAIFFVICAHWGYDNLTLRTIEGLVGQVGVPIFLIRGGYFLNSSEPAKIFWKKKFKSTIVPWIIMAPLLYAVTTLHLHNQFSLTGLFLYVIGYNTMMYFIVILLIYCIFFRIFKSDFMIYLSFVLFFASNILDVMGINFLTNITTTYLNFFNRIGYFALGILLSRKKLLQPVLDNKILPFICFPILAISSILYALMAQNPGPVIEMSYILYRVIFIYCVFKISNRLSGVKVLTTLGKNTYLIYFLHAKFGIFTVSLMYQILHINSEYIIFFTKPMLVLLLMIAVVFVLKKIVLALKLEKYSWIIGLKC